jgi:hypothetical protein
MSSSRGTLVEYTVPQKDEGILGYDLEEVMTNCRICVVRHKKVYQGGRTTYCTNIWAFSDDLSVRFEQKRKSYTRIILGVLLTVEQLTKMRR